MKRLILFTFAASLVFGQVAFRTDPTPIFTTPGNTSPGASSPMYAVPGVSIQLCTTAACTSPAIAYSDGTAATACPSNAAVTLPGSSFCQSTTSAYGQFGFWLMPGTYWYKATMPSGQIMGPAAITVGGSGGGGGGSGTVTSWSVGTIPSIFNYSVTNASTTPTFTFGYAGGQVSHQVLGTCGTATSFQPCSLVAADLPVHVDWNATSGSGLVQNKPLIPSISGSSPLKGSSGNAVAATASDLIALFNSGTCTGYLKSTGLCDAGVGAANVATGAGPPSGSCTNPNSGNLSFYYDTSVYSTWVCRNAAWVRMFTGTASNPFGVATTATSTVITHYESSLRYGAGAYTNDSTQYTITKVGGADSCVMRIYWDLLQSPPAKAFMKDPGCVTGNWALSSGSWVTGSAFPADTSVALSQITVSAGVIGTPVQFAASDTGALPPCGTGLVQSGAKCDVVPFPGAQVNILQPPFSATCNGATDDYSALVLANNAAILSGKPLDFTGCPVLAFGTPIAISDKNIVWNGNGVRLKYIGPSTTNAVSVTFGAFGIVKNHSFVLRDIIIDGNGLSVNGLAVTRSTKSTIQNVQITNVSGAGLALMYSVSDSITDFTVSQNKETFTTTPLNGIVMTDDGGGTGCGGTLISNARIEGVLGDGIDIIWAVTSTIIGGTSEGNMGYGIRCRLYCQNNVFLGTDLEVNAAGDLILDGIGNTFSGFLAYSSGGVRATSNAAGNTFTGYIENITLNSGTHDNTMNVVSPNTPINSGTNNQIRAYNPSTSVVTTLGFSSAEKYNVSNPCASVSAPAVCGSAAAGTVAIPAGSNTVTVNTTAVTTGSGISISFNPGLAAFLGATCDTTPPIVAPFEVSRIAGTSFTIRGNTPGAGTYGCYFFSITN